MQGLVPTSGKPEKVFRNHDVLKFWKYQGKVKCFKKITGKSIYENFFRRCSWKIPNLNRTYHFSRFFPPAKKHVWRNRTDDKQCHIRKNGGNPDRRITSKSHQFVRDRNLLGNLHLYIWGRFQLKTVYCRRRTYLRILSIVSFCENRTVQTIFASLSKRLVKHHHWQNTSIGNVIHVLNMKGRIICYASLGFRSPPKSHADDLHYSIRISDFRINI